MTSHVADQANRLAHQIEDVLSAEAFEDTRKVAGALVDAVETTELGQIAALLASEGNGNGQ